MIYNKRRSARFALPFVRGGGWITILAEPPSKSGAGVAAGLMEVNGAVPGAGIQSGN
jgi:hypothetical protein